ncbi:MAG: hypothetical protein EPO02_11930 [Nitrospirae bacterium]|nr:MAG: hypothetical protein EPO02_11930 [Nitrospirota bacterium]
MKKIKRKSAGNPLRLPAFVIGYAAPEPPPPGFLAAWFDQEYGGPLTIQLSRDPGTTRFEAHHGPWAALVETSLPQSTADAWHERLQWSHTRAAQILPLKMTGRESRDIVLLLSRLARGLTVLTGGTAYDTATESYLNPSDWTDRPLRDFRIADHLRIEQVEGRADGRVWFHTRGLSKFGVEDLETYRAPGLSERPVIEAFTEMAEALTLLGRAPNVGESFDVPGFNKPVRVVRHRTDQSYSIRLNLREVEWE